MTIYQSAYQLKMGRCSRCLRDNIPEDHLFLAGSEEFGVGWRRSASRATAATAH